MILNEKIILGCTIAIAIGIILIVGAQLGHNNTNNTNNTYNSSNTNSNDLVFITKIEGKEDHLLIPKEDLLFDVMITNDAQGNLNSFQIIKKPQLSEFYREVGFANESSEVVFIYPIFTQAAYQPHGFYDYYANKCDSQCLTVQLPTQFRPTYASSAASATVLSLLNYSYITDIDVDKNPDILTKYKRVIVLHNEYVTKNEFRAITNHQNVIFLYPNALYAEVKSDYVNNTITLVRGHGYPNTGVRNGFDWKYDNSNFEYDIHCDNWTHYSIPNGTMTNCYPIYRTLFDKSLLAFLRDSVQ